LKRKREPGGGSKVGPPETRGAGALGMAELRGGKAEPLRKGKKKEKLGDTQSAVQVLGPRKREKSAYGERKRGRPKRTGGWWAGHLRGN